MKKMTKEEIIRKVIVGMEAKKHRQSMQRIAHSACRTLKIVPYQSELAEYICGTSRVNNYEAVVKWLLQHRGDCVATDPISVQVCVDELEKHIVRSLPPYRVGDLYE